MAARDVVPVSIPSNEENLEQAIAEMKTGLAAGSISKAKEVEIKKVLKHILHNEFLGPYLYKKGQTVQVAKHSHKNGDVYSFLPDAAFICTEDVNLGKMKVSDDTPYLLVVRPPADTRTPFEQIRAGDAKAYRLFDAAMAIVDLIATGYEIRDLGLSEDCKYELRDIQAYGVPFQIVDGSPVED